MRTSLGRALDLEGASEGGGGGGGGVSRRRTGGGTGATGSERESGVCESGRAWRSDAAGRPRRGQRWQPLESSIGGTL